jgi:hypothetical protein
LDDSIGKDYEEILDDDFLHEVLFNGHQNNIEEIDKYNFLPMHEFLAEDECDRRCEYYPTGARDDFGSNDQLTSNDLNQCDLTKEVLYCDFGTIQITMSPIIPTKHQTKGFG